MHAVAKSKMIFQIKRSNISRQECYVFRKWFLPFLTEFLFKLASAQQSSPENMTSSPKLDKTIHIRLRLIP